MEQLAVVTLKLDLCPLRHETLAALLAAAANKIAPLLSGHARAESVLALAGSLGGLESAFHRSSFGKSLLVSLVEGPPNYGKGRTS